MLLLCLHGTKETQGQKRTEQKRTAREEKERDTRGHARERRKRVEGEKRSAYASVSVQVRSGEKRDARDRNKDVREQAAV